MNNLHPSENKFHAGNGSDGKHYWLTPWDDPAFVALKAEFGPFDFDPCPYPVPEGFDGLTCEWGQSNYVNPPFGSILHNGKKKGPTAWVRKAITEYQKGKRIVFVYPIDKWVLMILSVIGAKVRNLGDVKWRAIEDGSQGKGTGRHIACFILEPAKAQSPSPHPTPLKRMKILFLDFDGVILTLRTCVASPKPGWSQAPCDPVLVSVIKRCCDAGVRICVSSSWRDAEEQCKAKLEECGLINFLHADWGTPTLRGKEATWDRRLEIDDWIKRHPEVKDYRILDDDDWAWHAEQKERFLKCDPHDGASAQVLIALLEWAGAGKKETNGLLNAIQSRISPTPANGGVK